MPRILAKAPGRTLQKQRWHLFHQFYQVHIRLGSSNRLKNPWAGPDDTEIGATIGHAQCDNSRIIGSRRP
jgi:hypothetical protein